VTDSRSSAEQDFTFTDDMLMASGVIDADISEVWSIISDFGGLQRWYPQLERCECTGEGVGAVRTVHRGDFVHSERLEVLDPETHILTYSVLASTRASNLGVSSQMRLHPHGPSQTLVEWRSRHQNPTEAAALRERLEPFYGSRIGELRTAAVSGVEAPRT
jgi:hypothetical protein